MHCVPCAAYCAHCAVFTHTLGGAQVVENPDETFHLQLYSPGVQPTFGGNLWSRVLVRDDGDGGVLSRGYLDKLYAQAVQDEGSLFGAAVAMGAAGTVALVGSPHSAVDGRAAVGRVR
jgi:hypothetical protein